MFFREREHREPVRVVNQEWHNDFRRSLYTGGERLLTLESSHSCGAAEGAGGAAPKSQAMKLSLLPHLPFLRLPSM